MNNSRANQIQQPARSRFVRHPVRLVCCPGLTVAFVLLLLYCATRVRAQDTSQHAVFVDGLRQRQLFRLAEIHCQRQLARSGLDDTERAAIVIQLLKTYTQHAMNVPRDQRPELWASVTQTWTAFRQSTPEPSQWPGVELQYWLSEITRAELLRLEAEVSADRPGDLNAAIDVLRKSGRSLQALDDTVALLQRDQNRSPQSQRELQTLRNQIQFKLAQVLLQQALCYAPETPDNVHLLSQARDRFASLSRLAGESELTQLSQLGRLECQRRLRNFSAAQEVDSKLSAETAQSTQVQWKRAIESAEIKIAQNLPRQAAELLRKQLKRVDSPSTAAIAAEAELTLIRAYVELANSAARDSNAQAAKQWQSMAHAQLQQMEKVRPVYWVRRAEILLASIGGESADSADLDILARSAALQYRRGNHAAAIKMYARAAELARNLGDPQRSFDLDYRAAAILFETGQLAEALTAFRQVALGYPEHLNASQAHLLAIACAARLARASSGDLERYETLLHEQIRKWTNEPSVDQARFWLAKLQQQRREWGAANDTLLGISQSFPQIKEVHERIRTGVGHLLDQQQNAADRADVAKKAADYFQKVFLQNGELPTAWNQLERDAAVTSAVFGLLNTSDPSPLAAQYLDAALASGPAPDNWTARATSLAGIAHLLDGDLAASQDRLRQADWSRVDDHLDILARLDQEAQSAGAERSLSFASAALHISRAASPADAADRIRLARYEADALNRLGKRNQALAIYVRLVQEQPNAAEIHYRYAQLLETDSDDQDWNRALEQWRHVVRLSRPGTEDWFAAKLGIARTQLALGNADRAAEVIRLTQVLRPKLGGAQMKRRFLDLLRKCEQVTKH